MPGGCSRRRCRDSPYRPASGASRERPGGGDLGKLTGWPCGEAPQCEGRAVTAGAREHPIPSSGEARGGCTGPLNHLQLISRDGGRGARFTRGPSRVGGEAADSERGAGSARPGEDSAPSGDGAGGDVVSRDLGKHSRQPHCGPCWPVSGCLRCPSGCTTRRGLRKLKAQDFCGSPVLRHLR